MQVVPSKMLLSVVPGQYDTVSYLKGWPFGVELMGAAGSQLGGVTSCRVSWMTLHLSRRSDCVVADSEGLAFTCICGMYRLCSSNKYPKYCNFTATYMRSVAQCKCELPFQMPAAFALQR